MTRNELHYWRKAVPFLCFGLCSLPWILARARTPEQATFAKDFVAVGIAAVAAFFYLGLDLGTRVWDWEKESYVLEQIRDRVIALVPADLAVSDAERDRLRAEIINELTGVFWAAVERDERLKEHKELFYSNGIMYSGSIDVYLIFGFSGIVYFVAALILDDSGLAYGALVLIAVALASIGLVTPRRRARHLKLSTQQLDEVQREQRGYVEQRFREIIGNWRRERILR